MSAATILLMTSSANNAAAAARRRREKLHCVNDVMPGFQHNAATVGQMQAYASCVERVHPAQSHVGAAALVVLLIVGAFCLCVAGILRA